MTGTVTANDGEQVHGQRRRGATSAVTVSVAETVSVLADPSPPPRIALPEQLVLGPRALRALTALPDHRPRTLRTLNQTVAGSAGVAVSQRVIWS